MNKEQKLAVIKLLQKQLDDAQNLSENVLSEELYDRLYELRCDIASYEEDIIE